MNISDFNVVLTLFGSLFLGGVLGLEREWMRKPAGMRTHMLVAGAATLIVFLGDIILETFIADHPTQALAADPVRLLQAVVLGISFIGAGTIRSNTHGAPENLTTAASILMASVIGMLVAYDRWVLGLGVTMITLLITAGLGYIERRFDH